MSLDKSNAQKIAYENNIPVFLAMMLDVRNIVDKKNIVALLSEDMELINLIEEIEDAEQSAGESR